MNKVFVTGDMHRHCGELQNRLEKIAAIQDDIIILGDAGVNFYGKEKDKNVKEQLSVINCTFYFVRGNHDMPPFEVDGIKKIYNQKIDGYVYVEDEFPTLNYLIDGEIYNFNGYRCLVLGGAGSVDKNFRLENNLKWFEHEQIPEEERKEIFEKIKNQKFDFVFSHTCPYSWRPIDLFSPFVKQEEVDNSTEKWLEEVKNNISYDVWTFGHYHADRVERRRVELMYRNIVDLEQLKIKWDNFAEKGKMPWWVTKSPQYYTN